jgi:predicted nucleic acid-binding protein
MAGQPPAFVDTAYVLALVNTRDQWQAAAARWKYHLYTQRRRLITTEYVLIEIGDGLSAVRFRQHAARSIRELSGPFVEVVPASAALFDTALALYQGRPDKDWGLTDCASFVVMTDRGLTDALTADDHFRQAGFRPLLLEEPPAQTSA